MFPNIVSIKEFNIDEYLLGNYIYIDTLKISEHINILRQIKSDTNKLPKNLRKINGNFIEKISTTILQDNFNVSRNLVKKYRCAISYMNLIFDDYAKNLLLKTKYKTYTHGRDASYRFTYTENEAYHIDMYRDSFDGPKLRFFFNYSDEPRIWNIGEIQTNLIKAPYLSRNIIIKDYLNTPAMIPGEIMQHEFQPLTMWLCESQLIPHAGIYGTQLCTYTYCLHIK